MHATAAGRTAPSGNPEPPFPRQASSSKGARQGGKRGSAGAVSWRLGMLGAADYSSEPGLHSANPPCGLLPRRSATRRSANEGKKNRGLTPILFEKSRL